MRQRNEETIKIATYNVNGINARLPVLLRWLEQSEPDFVCLQELKAPQEKFPIEAIKDAGYDAVWHGQKSWNGVAILARGSTPQHFGGTGLNAAIILVIHGFSRSSITT